jgi:hypothetical protein
MRRALIILLLLAIAGGGIAYYLWNKAPESAANKKADYTVTPGELLQAFQADEEAANAKYLGKVLEVKGTIAEIIPGEDLEMQVILDTGDIMSRVSCVMEEDYQTFLTRKLKAGDTVTLKGFCTGMAMDIVLDRCVVVS